MELVFCWPTNAVGVWILRICDLLRKLNNIIIPVLGDGGGDGKSEGSGLQLLANNIGDGVRNGFRKPIKIVKRSVRRTKSEIEILVFV